MIEWDREANVSHTKTKAKAGGIVLSPWLIEWLLNKCERELRKITRAIEKVGDGNYGYLQEELLYCAQEIMEFHSYITYLDYEGHHN